MEQTMKTALKISFLYACAAFIYNFLCSCSTLILSGSWRILKNYKYYVWVLVAASILIYLKNRLRKENVTLRDMTQDPFVMETAALLTIVNALISLAVYILSIVAFISNISHYKKILSSFAVYGSELFFSILYLLLGIAVLSKAKSIRSINEPGNTHLSVAVTYLYVLITCVLTILYACNQLIYRNIRDLPAIILHYLCYYSLQTLLAAGVLLYLKLNLNKNHITFHALLNEPIVCKTVGLLVILGALLALASALPSLAESAFTLLRYANPEESRIGIRYAGQAFFNNSIKLDICTLQLLTGFYLLRRIKPIEKEELSCQQS